MIKEKDDTIYKQLLEIQDYLYGISSYIASQENEKYKIKDPSTLEQILEKSIDDIDLKLPPLKNFIHPGGSLEASHLHYARTIARKVERRYIAYYSQDKQGIYLKCFNRLSDYLFTSARYMNIINKVDDILVH